MKLTSRCAEEAVAGLNEALRAKAAQDKLLRTARVRAGATVIAADVACPADPGLLAKAVGRLVRTAARVQAAGGAAATVMTDRRRAAARRVREIASKLRARGQQLAPTVNRIHRRAGRLPRAVTADRGYGQPAAEPGLRDPGVRTVANPPPGQALSCPAGR